MEQNWFLNSFPWMVKLIEEYSFVKKEDIKIQVEFDKFTDSAQKNTLKDELRVLGKQMPKTKLSNEIKFTSEQNNEQTIIPKIEENKINEKVIYLCLFNNCIFCIFFNTGYNA